MTKVLTLKVTIKGLEGKIGRKVEITDKKSSRLSLRHASNL